MEDITMVDEYPQINDNYLDWILRREYCEQCANGRPICPDPCEAALQIIEEGEC
jgi:hypothetical protein